MAIGFVRSAVVVDKPCTLPSPTTDVRTVVFGGEAGVRGANVGSRDVNCQAWLIDDSQGFHMPRAICLSRLQSPQRHKAAGAILV